MEIIFVIIYIRLKYKDHSVIAKTVIGYTDGKEIKYFQGSIAGKIVLPKGNNGFGWDKIFLPLNSNKTFGEMTSSEKNKISMRKIAALNLKDYLNSTATSSQGYIIINYQPYNQNRNNMSSKCSNN